MTNPEQSTPETLAAEEQRVASNTETPEQVIARLGLDPTHIQTPGLVAHELTRNRAKALAAAEERRWTDLESRVTALERGPGYDANGWAGDQS